MRKAKKSIVPLGGEMTVWGEYQVGFVLNFGFNWLSDLVFFFSNLLTFIEERACIGFRFSLVE